MNPIAIAVAAVLVALTSSGIAGWACWRWWTARRTLRDLRTDMDALRTTSERITAEDAELRAWTTTCMRWITADLRALPETSDQGM